MINEHVLRFIKFATDNNEIEITKEMFDEGVVIEKGEDIKARLYKLFVRNREKFIRIFKNAGYNKNADNYTTQPNTIRGLVRAHSEYIAGEETSPVSREAVNVNGASRWWDSVLDTMVGGSDSVSTDITTTTKPAIGSQTTIIMVSILSFGGIVALIYFFTK